MSTQTRGYRAPRGQAPGDTGRGHAGLGTFATNLEQGAAITSIDGALEAKWQSASSSPDGRPDGVRGHRAGRARRGFGGATSHRRRLEGPPGPRGSARPPDIRGVLHLPRADDPRSSPASRRYGRPHLGRAVHPQRRHRLAPAEIEISARRCCSTTRLRGAPSGCTSSDALWTERSPRRGQILPGRRGPLPAVPDPAPAVVMSAGGSEAGRNFAASGRRTRARPPTRTRDSMRA